MLDKLPVIYNNICCNMGGNELVDRNRGDKSQAELERAEYVPIQTSVHLFSSLIETSNEVIFEDQGEDNDQVV